MGFVQRRLVKWVMGVVSYPRATVAVCAVLVAVAVGLAWFRLTLSTDQDQLLAPKLPFFRDYLEFTYQFPENDSFVVILEPVSYERRPTAKRWMAFADRVSAGLRELKEDVKRVEERVPLEELGERGLMFDEWEGVRAASKDVKEFVPLVKILGEEPGIEQVVLGRTVGERFFRAMAKGPAKDGKGLALVVTRSLLAGVKDDPGRAGGGDGRAWKKGVEIPDLTELDPSAKWDPSRYGYNMVPNEFKRGTPAYATEKMLVINVYPDRDFSSLEDVTEPLKRMRAVVWEAWKEFPEFKKPVITGRPALEADEMARSDRDITIAEILGLILVFVAMLIFLRNLWIVLVSIVCLGVGIAWTFGWATVAVGRLNLLSLVFVIALIGIGMDYLIQILTRYRFEKKRYKRPQAVWSRVFRYVSAPISTACAGAAGAFLVSALTDFRGAAELGIIAGGGLLLCLATGYTLLPALLTIWPASVGEVPLESRYAVGKKARGGGWRLIPGVVWIVVAAGGLWWALPVEFDANLLKLQAEREESVREVRKLRTWYAVVLSDDVEKLRKARAALMPKAGEVSAIDGEKFESVVEAEEKRKWLVENNREVAGIKWMEEGKMPVPNAWEAGRTMDAAETMVAEWGKQADAGALFELKDTVAELKRATGGGGGGGEEAVRRMGLWGKLFVRELRKNMAQFVPRDWDPRTLPGSLRDHLMSEKGVANELGPAKLPGGGGPVYAMYVYPKGDLWNREELVKFVKEVEARTPGDVMLTGIAPQLYHSTEAIHGAFVRATGYAIGLIVVLVMLDLRKVGQTLLAISVLALGLPMLLLAMWVWRYVLGEPWGIPGTWNFANFFALPILIGAGHEYGVFMVHRYREALHDRRRVWRRWDVSDRALLLCGIVTSASFGFMMRAEHHGLASLGWVMCVGTACIYLATVLVLRPVLQWLLKRRGIGDDDKLATNEHE